MNIKFKHFIAYYSRCIYYAIMPVEFKELLHKGLADFSRVSFFKLNYLSANNPD